MKKLPPFTVRESPRAKRVTLKISVRHGLEVVIPPGFSRARVRQIIKDKQEWLERALRKIQPAGSRPAPPPELPDSISLPAVNLDVAVEYVPLSLPFLELVHHHPATLKITGDLSDLQGCRDLLKRWLQRLGRVHLNPWLAQVSSETGLSCHKVQIRSQKTRWGSCSSRGTISLNQNLLFLPPELVRYLIIHELCHTVHLNHSAAYYQLLTQFVPDYRQLRAALQKAQTLVPWWAL